MERRISASPDNWDLVGRLFLIRRRLGYVYPPMAVAAQATFGIRIINPIFASFDGSQHPREWLRDVSNDTREMIALCCKSGVYLKSGLMVIYGKVFTPVNKVASYCLVDSKEDSEIQLRHDTIFIYDEETHKTWVQILKRVEMPNPPGGIQHGPLIGLD